MNLFFGKQIKVWKFFQYEVWNHFRYKLQQTATLRRDRGTSITQWSCHLGALYHSLNDSSLFWTLLKNSVWWGSQNCSLFEKWFHRWVKSAKLFLQIWKQEIVTGARSREYDAWGSNAYHNSLRFCIELVKESFFCAKCGNFFLQIIGEPVTYVHLILVIDCFFLLKVNDVDYTKCIKFVLQLYWQPQFLRLLFAQRSISTSAFFLVTKWHKNLYSIAVEQLQILLNETIVLVINCEPTLHPFCR